MILRDTKVSIQVELEVLDGMARGHKVTIAPTGDHGPNGWPMGKITGRYPDLILWLGSVYGLDDDDILAYIPSFQLEDLIP